MSGMVVFWLVFVIAAVVVELVSLGLTSIWLAGGALIAALVAGLGLPIWLQMAFFVVVTLLLLMFTRPIAVKYFNRNRTKTNVESMIGQQAIVISEIDNLQGIGQVTVGGNEWSARSEDASQKYAVGTVVVVKAVSGVKLIVSEEAE